MQSVREGYQAISLLIDINWDLLLYVFTILAAFAAAGWIGSLALG